MTIGHGGWVTSLTVGEEEVNGERQEFLLSGSRDKTLIKWALDPKRDEDEDKENQDEDTELAGEQGQEYDDNIEEVRLDQEGLEEKED
mgnify:CR=1 FL=1